MKVITVWNMKGGVGKTTISFNLGENLANKSYKNLFINNKVLFIDLDTQANLTQFFEPEITKNIKPVYEIKKENINFDIYRSNRLGTYFIKGSNKEFEFKNIKELQDLLVEIEELHKFDYVIIDCPPNNHIQVKNALYVSDLVLVPVLLDGFSISNLNLVIENLNTIKDITNEEKRYRVVINQLSRTKDKREKLNSLLINHDYPFLNMCLRQTAIVNNSLAKFKPTFLHRRKSGITEDFELLTKEIENILEKEI